MEAQPPRSRGNPWPAVRSAVGKKSVFPVIVSVRSSRVFSAKIELDLARTAYGLSGDSGYSQEVSRAATRQSGGCEWPRRTPVGSPDGLAAARNQAPQCAASQALWRPCVHERTFLLVLAQTSGVLAEPVRAGLPNPEHYRVLHRTTSTRPSRCWGHALVDACIVGCRADDGPGGLVSRKLRRNAPKCPVVICHRRAPVGMGGRSLSPWRDSTSCPNPSARGCRRRATAWIGFGKPAAGGAFVRSSDSNT